MFQNTISVPNTMSLSGTLKQAFASAQRENLEILQDIEKYGEELPSPIIELKRLIPLFLQISVLKGEKYSAFWKIPESDFKTSFFADNCQISDSPQVYLKNVSLLIFEMLEKENLPVVVKRCWGTSFLEFLEEKSVFYLALDLEKF